MISASCDSGPHGYTPAKMESALMKNATEEERIALAATWQKISHAWKNDALPKTQQEVLSNLFASALKNGNLSEDERTLLIEVSHDLASNL